MTDRNISLDLPLRGLYFENKDSKFLRNQLFALLSLQGRDELTKLCLVVPFFLFFFVTEEQQTLKSIAYKSSLLD
ncbi:MAG: hypothetical protein JJE08_03440 [Proteiniphilum sp.]|nr:hypothetical protein [Proteiniphilum sp.]